ncbi:hypothetical protein NLU13_4742 [Sarocladium strictum]|uniref:Rhodopsin domain-containing protein n=1 Tax=Sarocladium strictum TaxID=5046 RepID=A0AA39GKU5_SARSR|nr:hypothetical protein NLU13_4742 [Sarocladium strictum]
MARSLAADCFACVGVTFALATICTGFRFWARRMTNIQLWWDDWFALLAWITGAGWSGVIIAWTLTGGLGQKLDTLSISPEEAIRRSLIYTFNAELLYAFSLVFSKYAILGLYWRLFKTCSIRLPIQSLFVLSTVWIIIRTFMTVFHCVPTQAFWDLSITDKVCNIDNARFFFGTTMTHLFLDVAILALPIVQVRKLNLRKGQKLGVIGLFMFGVVVCVAAVVLIVSSTSFNKDSPEMPYDINTIMIPATVEVNFSIVSACLPMMRPIVQRFMHGSPFGSDNTSSGGGPRGGGTTSTVAKLRTLSQAIELDDNGSTQNFADRHFSSHYWANTETGSSASARGGCRDNNGGPVQSNPHPKPLQHGLRTVIKTTAERASRTEHSPTVGGIMITNEMTLSYENAQVN